MPPPATVHLYTPLYSKDTLENCQNSLSQSSFSTELTPIQFLLLPLYQTALISHRQPPHCYVSPHLSLTCQHQLTGNHSTLLETLSSIGSQDPKLPWFSFHLTGCPFPVFPTGSLLVNGEAVLGRGLEAQTLKPDTPHWNPGYTTQQVYDTGQVT